MIFKVNLLIRALFFFDRKNIHFHFKQFGNIKRFLKAFLGEVFLKNNVLTLFDTISNLK